MGIRIRKKSGKWYVYVNHGGHRKAKCVGTSRAAAEKLKSLLEAKIALTGFGLPADAQDKSPTFREYSDRWLKEYAEVNSKPSSVKKHREVLRLYLLPELGARRLDQLRRDQFKGFLAKLTAAGKLARNSIRLILATLRVILNHAVEDGLLASNPAAKLGRFAKAAKSDFTASPLTPEEAERFLAAAKDVCPEYFPLFLTALRAGLRRGELVALSWGDIQLGNSEDDPNRYILVQRNYVGRRFTSPKSKKPRRVDMSKQLRAALAHLRDQHLEEALAAGLTSITEDLVFTSPAGGVLDPDNLYHRYFLPCLERAGIRRIRFHDLRHTFGSLLIQSGASLAYVKDQMGHYSIQVTVDTYGHLLPGANVACVDRLDSPQTPMYKPSLY
jgi:integrase